MPHQFNITLRVVGPVLSRSTAVGRKGVDAPAARNADNQIILPGSLVKGRLAQAWNELATVEGLKDQFEGLADRWLGLDSGDQGGTRRAGVTPRRGCIFFGDFVLQPIPPVDVSEPARKRIPSGAGFRTRIQIDDARGAVQSQALQVLEQPVPTGTTGTFVGTIKVQAEGSELALIQERLKKGLRWITSLGGERTIGYGRIHSGIPSVAVAPCDPENRREVEESGPAKGETAVEFSLELTVDGPLCFARHRTTLNLHEARDEIPGAAIRGALAEKWRARVGASAMGRLSVREYGDASRPQLATHFDSLVFSDAFPTKCSARPTVPPQSLVRVGERENRRTLDASRLNRAFCVGGKAPDFAVDWKDDDFTAVRPAFGWHRPAREIRVRTALNPVTRKADEQRLFAWETILPEPGAFWRSRVSLAGVPEADRPDVARQLSELLSGELPGLSKTKASATVRLVPVTQAAQCPPAGPEGWTVVLQTPALLCDPRLQRNERDAAGNPVPPSGPLTPEEMLALYRATWRQLSSTTADSGGTLELSHYFARQCLMGGHYLWQRFVPDLSYNPWLLTEAGSVFVLKPVAGKEEAARQWLANRLPLGLPIPEWAIHLGDVGRPEAFWRRCPFVPENGWGEFLVNPPLPPVNGQPIERLEPGAH